MASPLDLCRAKSAVVGRSECGFGTPNKLNPSVVFAGCPACQKDSASGVTVEQARTDMETFVALLAEGRGRDDERIGSEQAGALG